MAEKQPQSQGKNENEGVYEEVEANKKAKAVDDTEVMYQNVRFQQTLDIKELLPDKAAERCRRYQQLCCCFGTLCVILVLSVIGVCVHFTAIHESTSNELNQLKSSQQVLLEENQNLTNLNNKLSSDNKNLTIQFDNLTMASHALENNITMLTTEKSNLTSLNEELKEQKKNLTEKIKNMEETWDGLNVSRAQWSIDEYCPKTNAGRSCNNCQKGWTYKPSSCYAYNNAPPSEHLTWEDARENCKQMIADLTVVSNQAEKVMEEQF
ncbi:uncharacterized protein LOC129370842 [Poeciliopsis prolifica]|uniref:uncharacterized protein LOC129370842 n=1 Tax=Poeciliopsis prolifica TaxID=188132 RepID=UPI002413B6E9|nr:uncharacterized protein LOC129370842 [Poeciliopsis prolifica]